LQRSYPVYFYFNFVAGIKATSPGFKTVEIAPNFGTLKNIKTSYPTINGAISLELHLDKKGKLKGEITLPQGTTGVFKWKGNTIELKSGVNDLLDSKKLTFTKI